VNPWSSLKSLPREIWVLCATTLTNRVGTMVLPFLVLYLTRALGLPPGRAGFVVTVYGLVAMVTGPLAGRLADRIGALRVMKASLVLSGLLLIVFPLARSYGAVLLAAAVLAVFNEAYRPAGLSTLTALTAPGQRRPAFALNRLAVNLGMSVGPAAGGILAGISFTALFWVDGITSLLAAAVLILSPWRSAAGGPASARGSGREDAGTRHPLRDGRFMFLLAAFLPSMLVFFQLESTYPLHLVGVLGLPPAAFGFLLTLNTALILIFEVPLNAAMAGWPHRRALPLGALLCAAGFGSTAFASGPVSAAAGVVVWTFGEMVLLPGTSACVAEMAPESRRGEYMGLYVMSFSLALATAPWAGAVVLERFGPDVLWGGTACLGLLSALLLAFLRTDRPAERDEGGSGDREEY
jgi:predicted MFS family arabinose efflux permease